MKNLKNKKLVSRLFLISLAVFFVVTPVFAAEVANTAELSGTGWFKYLEIVGVVLAFIALVQGMTLISRVAGGSLAKSFMWYPIGTIFIGIALILRMVTEWSDVDSLGFAVVFEVCIYLGLLFWVIGTQKSIKALK